MSPRQRIRVTAVAAAALAVAAPAAPADEPSLRRVGPSTLGPDGCQTQVRGGSDGFGWGDGAAAALAGSAVSLLAGTAWLATRRRTGVSTSVDET